VLTQDVTLTPGRFSSPVAADDLVVLGTVCDRWKIDRITTDVTELLGFKAADLLGRPALDAVHPEDIPSLVLLVAHTGNSPGGCGRIRIRNSDGGWVMCRVVVRTLAGPAAGAFAFALSPVSTVSSAGDGPRVRELEDHLRRIAREIAAAGVAAWSTAMPTSIDVPELSRLTSREYEIVVRLASGDRVPAIARGLFLSESTVRNHLTSVYRKFGVHSQTDLMTRLRSVP
jgi:DNA-binding CsgD family transcriptional regulator